MNISQPVASECDCVSVEIGSHAVAEVLPIPVHMASYRLARLRAGLSGTVCVDRCLVPEIKSLWSLGIKTTGCCCGHNKTWGYIGVFPECIEQMKTLGYKTIYRPDDPGRGDSFFPKSLPLRWEKEVAGARKDGGE